MKYLLFFIFITCFNNGFCSDTLNCYNNVGQKTGFWKVYEGNMRRELYYRNGKLNGICKYYYQNGTLSYFGSFCENRPIEKGYSFHEKGYLLAIWDSIIMNKKVIKELNGTLSVFRYSCHSFEYDNNGNMTSDGLILFEESPDFESIKFGLWRFYDSSEIIIKIIDYGDSYLLNEEGVNVPLK